ncbi:DNA repair protein RAD5A [Vitis vinifera]|uniref:DNA repair protein RAD5A n=1 Tax=Vitis vinifera TaxID=29760 RepID=A0A438F407_VITVI|nr:DNA repair protein RAD5A [Vitis vinifera]
MGKKVTDELLSTVRSVIGLNYSDMDIIRALHMANNDVTAAINIIFDTPNFGTKMGKNTETFRRNSSSVSGIVVSDSYRNEDETKKCSLGNGTVVSDSNRNNNEAKKCSLGSNENDTPTPSNLVDNSFEASSRCSGSIGRRRMKSGDEVFFTFPLKKSPNSPSPGKLTGRGRQMGACSEIVRFSTKESGEVGRIPNEWARCLLPLVRDKKVKIEGFCKAAPDVLGIMDTILLSISNCQGALQVHPLNQACD